MDCITYNVWKYARSHPWSVATLIVALPGVLLFVVDGSLCATGLCDETMPMRDLRDSVMSGLTKIDATGRNLHLPALRWIEKSTLIIVQILREASNNMLTTLAVVGQRLNFEMGQSTRTIREHWISRFASSQTIALATLTVLPGMSLVLIRKSPNSWVAQHQTSIASAIQIPILIAVTGQNLSIQDLLIAAFVVVSLEAMHRLFRTSTRSAGRHAALSPMDTRAPRSNPSGSPKPAVPMRKHSSSNPEASFMSSGYRDTEIERLHARLAEMKTAEKVREIDLRRTKAELLNARTTLNETFVEYASARDELKMIKQTLGRDHQAEIYRKDIELFALRKANEQKENYIKDREVSYLVKRKDSS